MFCFPDVSSLHVIAELVLGMPFVLVRSSSHGIFGQKFSTQWPAERRAGPANFICQVFMTQDANIWRNGAKPFFLNLLEWWNMVKWKERTSQFAWNCIVSQCFAYYVCRQFWAKCWIVGTFRRIVWHLTKVPCSLTWHYNVARCIGYKFEDQ